MIRNFIFHSVVPQVNDPSLQMNLVLFEKCIQFICSRYEVICIEDVMEPDSLVRKQKPFASLTFDDGFKDNIIYAAPILKKYNCRASFYVVTNCVEENQPPWSFMLEYLVTHTHVKDVVLDGKLIPRELRLKSLSPDMKQRMAHFKKLKSWLKKIPVERKEVIFKDLCSQMNDVELPDLMMDWNDLAALRKAGHYIGSHTHTHNSLTMMESASMLKEELSRPRELIKKHLGYEPVSIAYPFGFYNEKVKIASADAGYAMGIAADKHQIFYIGKHDYFEIPRIALCSEPWYKTKLRITNRIEQIKSLLPTRLISKR